MLTLFLLAGLLSVVLLAVVAVGLAAGGMLLIVGRPAGRALAPYAFLVPSLGALGAMAGAWGCAIALARSMMGNSMLPLWGWLVGLVAGGALGVGVGCALAYRLHRRMAGSAASDRIRDSLRGGPFQSAKPRS